MKMERLSAAAREQEKLYQKEWRRKNRDKIREHNAKYWERKALQAAAQREKTGTVE